MLTCCSEIDLVISDKSPVLSSASTWIAARNRELSRGAQCTVTMRSGSDSTRCAMLTQPVRCTDTPLPLVTKPTISSPGTGVQHLDSLAHRRRLIPGESQAMHLAICDDQLVDYQIRQKLCA